ncbi:MAG TPA: HD domain-containing phosphohydrolase [Gemmatimonadales bacterium]|nr:HD domain-containing phosphohydrolase [Gemmatimonadales bacterium]
MAPYLRANQGMRETYPDSRILIVDDEPDNLRVLARILASAGYREPVTTSDPREAAALFREHGPDLVLLDLHMPGLDGLAVLLQIRELNQPFEYLPVIMLTGDTTPDAMRRALGAGANDFITKPFSIHEVLLRMQNLLETRHLHQTIMAQNRTLEARVRERTAELDGAYLETLERLAIAAEFRDDDTGRHTERVGESAALIARELGLGEDEVTSIRLAAPLHDVGKIGISDAVLRKPGPLTGEEWEVMKSHSTIGARILSGGRSPVMRLAEEIALHHHERWDGGGYPTGARREEIPLAARIVAVADVFDALTSDRPYRAAEPVGAVIDYIQRYSRVQFDPDVADLCAKPRILEGLVGIRVRDGVAMAPATAQSRHRTIPPPRSITLRMPIRERNRRTAE